MKKFFEEHHVTPTEVEQLKAELLKTIFTRDQWYNRHRGKTPLSKAEEATMKSTLDKIRANNK